MNYRVVVAHEAEKVLDRLDRPTEQRVRARFLQLAEDPFDSRLSAPLTERPGVRKSRVGGWRILFTVDRDARVLFVATVDTRGQVYKHS
ncbi:MAG: type II toxin-antitoxin system RelE/ParE family toxin [Acidobacteria bacterium]|nr:type II toxin-antitoxin system RelE/ParE family toxin [Acidobacteriota bacterium]